MSDDFQLYRERSHQDAKALNDHARAAAQATILINGGAATVVIALFTKGDKVQPNIAKMMPFALGSYALGVMFGALMMFFMALSIQQWAIVWQGRALKYSPEIIDRNRRWGYLWRCKAYVCFFISIGLFLLGSAIIAWEML
jgi:hypothetical protein